MSTEYKVIVKFQDNRTKVISRPNRNMAMKCYQQACDLYAFNKDGIIEVEMWADNGMMFSCPEKDE